MKGNSFILSGLIFCVGLVAGLILSNNSFVSAQEKKDFSNIEIVYPSMSSIGMFDKSSGKLYYYDLNLKCTKILQIEELGQPLTKLDPPPRWGGAAQ